MTNKRIVIFILIAFVFAACVKEDYERFSFTLNFSLQASKSLAVNDTLVLISEHSDTETDYYSGNKGFIASRYFDTELEVLELGHFGNGTNCRVVTDAIQIITEIGSSDNYLFHFAHIDSKYAFLAKIIPLKAGVYALLLNDYEEVIKVFKSNFNRDLLNEYNIYELSLADKKIPIDERICFIKVE